MKSNIPYLIFFSSAIFLSIFFLIHFIKPELNFYSNTLSRYALGDSGYILTLGFYCFAVAEIACAIWLVLHARIPITTSPLFFILAGTGAILVSVFPVQPLTADFLTRIPHTLGAIMQFLFFPLALFAVKGRLMGSSLQNYTRITAYLTAILFVILLGLFALRPRYDFPYFGLLEKVDIILITFWLIVFSVMLKRKSVFKT